jgi:hypothetical protein
MALPPGAFRSAVTEIETSMAREACKARFEDCAMFLDRLILTYTSGGFACIRRPNGGETHGASRWLDIP